MAELSVRDKNKMVADIKVSYKLVRDIWKSAIEQSIEFGGKLVYCKSQIEHGSWLKFLEVSDIPQRTATGAMRMYEHRELLREKSAENWVDAVRIIQDDAKPNRQRIADLSEQTRSPDGGCTGHLEVQAVPRLTSQEDLEQEKQDEKVRKNREQFDSSLEYATALTSWSKCIFVSRLLASIDTDSLEFELLRYEIWDEFGRKYANRDIAREKRKLFREAFFDETYEALDESQVADILVRVAADDGELLGCLNSAVERAGSFNDAIIMLRFMQLMFSEEDDLQ